MSVTDRQPGKLGCSRSVLVHAICERSSPSSAALPGRSSGIFASKRMTRADSAGGTSVLSASGGGGSSWRSLAIRAIGDLATNGRRPVRHSYRTTPVAYRSPRTSTVSAGRGLGDDNRARHLLQHGLEVATGAIAPSRSRSLEADNVEGFRLGAGKARRG